MATQYYGQPTPAQIQLHTDTLATVLKAAYVVLGTNAVGDTTGIAALADLSRRKNLGDGSTTYPGLGNPPLQRDLIDAYDQFVKGLRYDTLFRRGGKAFFAALSTAVLSYLPSGWNFNTGGITQAIDAHLLRLNGAHSGVPTTPGAAGVLSNVYDSTGTLPAFTSGNCPLVCHTLVGTNDYDESLPSPNATQIALVAPNNALSYAIAGTVPAGVTNVRVYRTVIGATGVQIYQKEVAVTPGLSYPAILLAEPDSALRQDVLLPGWMQIPLVPEAAAYLAMANGTIQATDLGGELPMVINSAGMFSPSNVVLGVSSGFLGLANPAQSGQFGVAVVTGASTFTYTGGTIQTANAPANAIQGFAGALGTGTTGLQARITQATNNPTTLTFSYTYYDATNGWGNPQTSAGNNVTITPTTVGTIQAIPIPAGRVVRTVTVTAKSNTSTAGTLVIEGVAPRSY